MPVAPVAKGLILSISFLLAAGFAVYDSNPRVRQWVDESRRKIAIAMQTIDDNIHEHAQQRSSNNRNSRPRPPPRHRSTNSSGGASGSSDMDHSTREDDSPEAAERRRRAREEILERGRVMELRRRTMAERSKTRSFDDIVNVEGKLKEDENDGEGAGLEVKTEDDAGSSETATLKNRIKEADGAALGAAMANPFADEMEISSLESRSSMDEKAPLLQGRPGDSTETLAAAPPAYDRVAAPQTHLPTQPPVSLPPLNTDQGSGASAAESPAELTPTTSLTPSFQTDTLSDTDAEPVDAAASSSASASAPVQARSRTPHETNMQSVHEWAEASTASFYSPPQSINNDVTGIQPQEGPNIEQEALSEDRDDVESVATLSTALSVVGSQEGLSEAESFSDVGGELIHTPDGWSEVESVVSEEAL